VGKDRMDLLRCRLSGNPRLTGEQMLEPLPEIAKVARVEVDRGNPYDQGSYEALRKLALRAEELLQSPDVDGLVYVQGTNTIYNALSSDAQMNLLDAVRLACAPASRGKGAVVAFNSEINAAREVTKTNTYHLQTFRHP
jgi:glutamin-(asparagin-)ase